MQLNHDNLKEKPYNYSQDNPLSDAYQLFKSTKTRTSDSIHEVKISAKATNPKLQLKNKELSKSVDRLIKKGKPRNVKTNKIASLFDNEHVNLYF